MEEEAMTTSRLFYGTMVLTLAGTISGAAAQVGGLGQSQTTNPSIQLDAAQRAAIVTAVRDARIPPPGNSFSLSVGAPVPPSIELYALPIAALSQAPEARNLRYTMVQNQVVLVDPVNMRVVDVIRAAP
jgi:uncharacterized protein DUF1236